MTSSGNLSAGRQALSDALKGLEDQALRERPGRPRRRRTEAIAVANARLAKLKLSLLDDKRVSEWVIQGTPTDDFVRLWTLIDVLLGWTPVAQRNTAAEQLYWKALWNRARDSPAPAPKSNRTPQKDATPRSNKVSPSIFGSLVSRGQRLIKSGDADAAVEVLERAFNMASQLAEEEPKFKSGKALALYLYGVAICDSGELQSGRSIAGEAASMYLDLGFNEEYSNAVEFSCCMRLIAEATVKIEDDPNFAEFAAWESMRVMAELTLKSHEDLEASNITPEDITRGINASVITLMQVLVAIGKADEAEGIGNQYGIPIHLLPPI